MGKDKDKQDRPLRVVIFGGGPVLERGVKQFVCRLEAHPEIEFLGGFCQSPGQSFADVFRDLWKRRRFLAFPLLLADLGGRAKVYLVHPRQELQLKRNFNTVAARIYYVKDIHAPEVLESIQKLDPDLGLVYGSPILKPVLFDIPHCGTLGIHHGKVPEYRGKKTTFWAIYNREVSAGVTIQKINAGLDKGDIVKKGEVEIGRKSPSRVWEEIEALGLDLYIQAILELKHGTATFLPQAGQKGILYRDPKPGQILAVWLRYFKGKS